MNPYAPPMGMMMGMRPMMPGMMPPGMPPQGMPPQGMPPQGMPPGMGMPGMGARMMGPPAVKSAEQTEKYTIFVSKIGDMDDGFVGRLLSLCGTVLEWKRPRDADGKVKGFGVCDYEGPEPAMRAMRLLANLQVDDLTLALKMGAEQQKKMEAYKLRAEQGQVPGAENPAERQMKDQQLRQIAAASVGDQVRRRRAARGLEPAGDESAAGAAAVPPAVMPPPGVAGPPGVAISAAPPPVVSEADRLMEIIAREDKTDRDKEAPDKSSQGTGADEGRGGSQRDEKGGGRRDERHRAVDDERSRDREFRERERRWEEREKQTARNLERDRERKARDRERVKEQSERAEEALVQEQKDLDEGRRGAEGEREYRRKTRRRKREQELQDDVEDRKREQEEEKRKSERDARERDSDLAKGPAVEQQHSDDRPDLGGVADPGQAAQPSMPTQPLPSGPAMGPIGPIGPPGRPNSPVDEDKSIGFGMMTKPKTKTAAESERKSRPKPIFGVDEDPDAKKRKLVKLDYTAEQLAGSSRSTSDARSAAAAAAAAINQRRKFGTQAAETPQDRAKRLIASVPKEKDALYAMAVDWGVLERAKIFESKMLSWVTKKVTEYFGEPEETVISFVLEELAKRTGATEMIDNLGPILEGDCDEFVFKMWRMLIFEMLSAREAE